MELIQKYIIDTNVYIQIIPVIAGIICYSKLNKNYKLFIWILIFSVFIDVFKLYYGTYIHIGYNRIWTNLYNIIYFLFLFLFFYKTTSHKFFKKIILIIILLYFFAILYEVFIEKLDYHTYSQVIPYIIGGVGIMMCTFDYLIGIINLEKEVNLFRDFLFWFVIAHFIYFLALTSFKISDNSISLIDDYISAYNIIYIVTFIKCILLTIGFLWTTYKK